MSSLYFPKTAKMIMFSSDHMLKTIIFLRSNSIHDDKKILLLFYINHTYKASHVTEANIHSIVCVFFSTIQISNELRKEKYKMNSDSSTFSNWDSKGRFNLFYFIIWSVYECECACVYINLRVNRVVFIDLVLPFISQRLINASKHMCRSFFCFIKCFFPPMLMSYKTFIKIIIQRCLAKISTNIGNSSDWLYFIL